MPLFVEAGTITTSGTSTSVTGVGFRPTALQLWITVPGNGIAHSAVVWAQSSGAITRYAWSQDNLSTTNTGSATVTGTIRLVSQSGTLGPTGTIGTTSDGFTITWSSTPSPAVSIGWLAIGGTAQAFTTLSLVRNDHRNNRLSIGNVPFTPQIAMMFPADAGGGNLGFGVAAGASGSQQWALATFSKDASGTADTQTAFFYGSGLSATRASVAWLRSDLTVIRGDTEFAADGATVTFNRLPSNNGVYSFATLFIAASDAASEAGYFTKGSGTNWTWAQTKYAALPRGLVVGTSRLSSTTPSVAGAGFLVGMGAASENAQWNATFVDANAASVSDSSANLASGNILRMPTYTSGTVTYPNIGTSTLSGNQNKIVFNPNTEATNDLVGYLLFLYNDPYPLVITPKYQLRAVATVTPANLSSNPTASLSNSTTPANATVTVSPASLQVGYFLGSPTYPAYATAVVTATAVGIGYDVSIGEAIAEASVTATAGILGTQILIGGSATGVATASGALALNPRIAATIQASARAVGVFAYRFPAIATAGTFEIPGTINVARNPDYVIDGFWSVSAGGTIAGTSDSWNGTQAATVTIPADGTVTLPSIAGLGINGGNQWYGSVYAKNLPANMELRLTAYYSDGSHHHSSWHNLTATSIWNRIGHNVTTSGGKVLTSLELAIHNDGATSATFKLDGLQIEERNSPSPFCSGNLGAPAGVWLGGANVSPSYRATLPMALRTYGTGGAIRVSGKLYRATWDNRWLDDLSPWVVDGSVSYNREADIAWELGCRMLGDGWEQLTPYLDWVAPVLSVEYPDGTTQTAQLGLYLVMDSPENHNEWGYTVDLVANDPCYLLRIQGFAGKLLVPANTNKTSLVRQVLDSAVLTGGDNSGIPKRYVIPHTDKTFKHKREWPKETNKLELVNEVLWSAGFSHLFSTSAGMLTTRKRSEDRLRDRQPLRMYAANGSTSGVSDVVGSIATEAIRDDLENEIVILSDGVDSDRIQVRGRITGGDRNSRKAGTENNRRRTRKIKSRLVEDDVTAGELAKVLLEEFGLRNNVVKMAVIPEPELLAAMPWETVGLAIYNAGGTPVATGQYLIDGFTVGFTPNTATAKLDLARIDGLDAEITVNVAEV